MTKVMTRRPRKVARRENATPPPARSRRLTPWRDEAPLSTGRALSTMLAAAMTGFRGYVSVLLLAEREVLGHLVRRPGEEVLHLGRERRHPVLLVHHDEGRDRLPRLDHGLVAGFALGGVALHLQIGGLLVEGLVH